MAVAISRAADLAAVGANACAWTVDQGIAAPPQWTNLTTSPSGDWTQVGAISDDGIARAFSEKTQDVFALGQQTPYLSLVTQQQGTYTFTLLEAWRDIVKSVVYRKPLSEVQADETGKFSFAESASGQLDLRAWMVATFKTTSGNGMEWFYMPSASVALSKDQTFSGDGVASIEVAITPYPDTNGNTIYHLGQLPTGITGAGTASS